MLWMYAMGGGLGHLTRVQALLTTLSLTEEILLVTASPFADRMQFPPQVTLLQVPSEFTNDRGKYLRWLQDKICHHPPRSFWVDTFPAGILGELPDLSLPEGCPTYLLARLLKWDHYRARFPTMLSGWARTYVLEPLTHGHRRYVEETSSSVVELSLEEPPLVTSAACAQWLVRMKENPTDLVVHSGSTDEVRELLDYALERRRCSGEERPLLLVCQSPPASLPPGVEVLRELDVRALMPAAETVYSGAGFNSMRQASTLCRHHLALPFERRWDDQFLRARRAHTEATRSRPTPGPRTTQRDHKP